MVRIPCFIEVIHSAALANVQICRKVMPHLFKKGIAPLPFAGSYQELRSVLHSLKQRGIMPSIFVMNAFWGEELLQEADALFGPTPLLLFRREIFSDPTMRAVDASAPQPESAEGGKLAGILRRLSPRPVAIWDFGSGTCIGVAEKAANAIHGFLQDGNFARIMNIAESRQGSFLRALALAEDRRSGGGWAVPASGSGPRPATGETTAFMTVPRGVTGSLEQLGLSTLLMMLEMEKKSGVLNLTRDGEDVRCNLCKGRAFDASVNSNRVDTTSLHGAEGIYYALSWSDGHFEFTPGEIKTEDRIRQTVTSLLMEGARRMDEVCRAAD